MFRLIGALLGPFVALLDWLWPFKNEPLPVELGEGHSPLSPSTNADISAAIEGLHAKLDEWRSLTCRARAALLRQCLDTVASTMRDIAQETARVKGSYSSGEGEEMSSLFPVMLALEEYETAMKAGGQPKPVKLAKRSNGQWVADTFPTGLTAVAFGGIRTEVWMKPGAEPTQGKLYRDKAAGKAAEGGITAVLAAGNHLCVAMLDLLHELLVHDCVCAVKLNPANDFTGTQLERAFAPLHSAGYFKCLYGGPDVAQKLIHHDRVTRVHMTGAAATYNAIVWGPGKPRVGKPLLSKPFSAELGCVTPIIIVPSSKPWSQADLEYHAASVLSSKFFNAGANCNATEVLVTARHWPQRDAFLAAVRKVLSDTPQRWSWYPGSEAKLQAFKERFPHASEFGLGLCSRKCCSSPWLLAAGLTPDTAQTDRENWCGALQEVALDTPLTGEQLDIGAFLSSAVHFCNERCMGSLAMGMVIHPETRTHHDSDFQAALDNLRYGSIVVNGPATLGFAFPSVPWGAWGAAGTAEDIGSGNSLGHNTFLFDAAEKGIVYFPWRQPYTPFYFASNTNVARIIVKVSDFIRSKNIISLSMIIPEVLKSK